MSIAKRQIALLHVAKGKLDLSEEHDRATLVHMAGVTSSTELDQDGFDAIMGFFAWMGLRPLAKTGPNGGDRPGMARFAQLEPIRVLWAEWTKGAGTADGLNTWIERTFHASSLRFLTKGQGQKAITALKAMKARAA